MGIIFKCATVKNNFERLEGRNPTRTQQNNVITVREGEM